MAVRFSADGQDYTSASIGLTGQPFTVTCWVQLRADRNDFSTIFSVDDGGATEMVYVQTNADGVTLFLGGDGGASTVGSVALTVDVWYRVAVTYSGTTGTLYTGAAGAALASASGTLGTNTGLSTLRIGESGFADEWLNGCVANLKMWSAALSAGEIETELGQYVPARLANLLRWHPFVAAETTDRSGNGLTLSGGTGTSTEGGPPIPWAGIAPL